MPPLPTGTLTFLFTDIEGSTQRWERQPEAMAAALVRHDDLLQSTIERYGGHVFKTVGDAFHAAFANADDALAAAIDGQQALAREPWTAFGADFTDLRVRMGVHTGRAEARGGDYFGPVLNRTARLLSAGHGGQILLSLATQQLLRDVLPAQVALRDWGEHRLKDLHHAEQIFQVVGPNLLDIDIAPVTIKGVSARDGDAPSIPRYLDFDLEFKRAGDAFQAEVLHAPTRQQPSVTFQLPFSAEETAGLQLQVVAPHSATHRDLVSHHPLVEAMPPEEFGGRLFRAVFTRKLLACWRNSVSQATEREHGLRIRLHLTDTPELAVLPWEYLYDPEFERFLCLSTYTPVVRFLNLAETAHVLSVEPPLRMLAMIASPEDRARLDVEREWEKLKTALGDLEHAGLVQVDRLEAATLPALRRRLRRQTYHVFHYIGDGAFDNPRGDGILLLEDETGNSLPTLARDIGIHLHDHRSLRLVVLNACEGARGAGDDLFAGTAQTLIRQGIPAIVAMQFEISDEAAIVLASEFYEAIADDYPVDVALTAARTAVHDARLGAEWGTPVLYMRAPDGRIFHIPRSRRRRSVSAPRTTPDRGPEQAAESAPPTIVAPHGRPQPSPAPTISPPPTPTIPPPPQPVPPPDVSHFVGRAAELEHLGAALDTRHMVVITGMTGVGKTALAAMLARRVRPAEDIFWHQFRAGQGPDAIVWQLAIFLAHHGQARLWEILEGGRQSGSPPPPPDTLFLHLLELARGRGFLIVLDDFHLVDRDPLIDGLVERMRDAVRAGELKLIVIAERRPPFPIDRSEVVPLPGLSLADTRAWALDARLALPDADITALHAGTGGNAQFLLLALQALQRGRDPVRLIGRLAEVDDIERFLLEVVYERLEDAERAVMRAVAVLLGYPGSRGVIEAVLGGAIPGIMVRRTVLSLCDRYLLSAQEGEGAVEEFALHALVQAFFYGLLEPAERRAMHARAGAFYEASEPDASGAPYTLKAARHFERAGEAAHAAALVLRDLWTLINRGHARELKVLLDRFTPDQLDVLVWAELRVARGTLSALLGDTGVARASFDQALARLGAIEASDAVRVLTARACREMGTTVLLAAPREALAWFDRGLAAVAPAGVDAEAPDPRRAAAALYVYTGAAHMALADYAAALAALERGMALLPPEPSQLRAGALLNLASVYGNQGDLARAKAYSREGLAVCEAIYDDFRRIELLNNLALILELQGEWVEAKANYSEALALAERIGDVTRQAKLALNLGILATNQGDDATAEAELGRCVEMGRAGGLSVVVIAGLASLADLYLRRAQANRAEPLVAEAERLAKNIGSRGQMAEIERAWAEVKLARGDVAEAAGAVERSLMLARELGQEDEEGRSLRVQGEVLAAGGEREAMNAAFEQSAALLAEEELYEAARTRLAWARALVAAGDPARAAVLAREARMVFRGLGARRDEAAAERVLRAVG